MPAQHDAFFDAGVFADAHLATEHDVFLDHDAAGEAGLRSNHYIFPNLAVVPDVNQVVDLGAAPDASDFERSTIDGRVRPDLYVISNFQAPYLGKFFVVSGRLVADIAEAVAAQHRSGMNNHAAAQARSRDRSSHWDTVRSRWRC